MQLAVPSHLPSTVRSAGSLRFLLPSPPLASISYVFTSISNVNACGMGVIPILALWDGF